jgi:hypothetical protein
MQLMLTKPDPPVGVRLLELREEQCRWPLDEKQPPERFCGAPTVEGTSWCAAHLLLVFRGYGRARLTDH